MAVTSDLVFASSASHHGPIVRWARSRPMNEPMPFMSRCPRCGFWCLQDSYTRRTLLRLTNTDGNIQGYCIGCDGFWPINDHERDVLINWLGE